MDRRVVARLCHLCGLHHYLVVSGDDVPAKTRWRGQRHRGEQGEEPTEQRQRSVLTRKMIQDL